MIVASKCEIKKKKISHRKNFFFHDNYETIILRLNEIEIIIIILFFNYIMERFCKIDLLNIQLKMLKIIKKYFWDFFNVLIINFWYFLWQLVKIVKIIELALYLYKKWINDCRLIYLIFFYSIGYIIDAINNFLLYYLQFTFLIKFMGL